ncbi:MarR family transcriptional regulator [Asanoa ishikariensis]|uniref:Transcriptional regulator, MarR family n=1 Tax=Asanoa ishikariensis TaxID=137265 RepID=A0A1H3TVA6_9ACTN|nr:MarR family transcriptional regulator [Asanoa ishikariensis]GIF67478.1 MarR family transcriptional regulator [Asanoa ishikariensis]SDZ53645.1 transcriptional regulator, MarR family [Asanoa ishikariensis]
MASTQTPRDRVDGLLEVIAERDPERDLNAKAVTWRLRRASHRIDTEIRRQLAAQGMELWELEILCALRNGGGTLTMGALLDAAQITSGAITNRVARLERDGYVRREMAPDDRRQVLVTITPAGLDRNWQVIAANNAAEQEIFATIDPDLQRRLSEDLRAVLLTVEGPAPTA